MKILGVRIDNFTKQETLNKVSEFLNLNKQNKIFTPNPEMLVDAQKDEYFRNVLNSGDLNVCDGVGIQIALSLRGHRASKASRDGRSNPNEAGDCHASLRSARNDKVIRISGVDLMLDICKIAEEKNKSVYFLGSGDEDVISNLKLVIKNKFSKLKISGAHSGHQLLITNYQLQFDREKNNDLIADIVLSSPDILFVAFGHGKQEKWIQENLRDLPSVKIAMGVGGAFDYISGRVKRAPLFLRRIGLEWMWRLIKQPKRIGRIFKATFIFLYYYFFHKS